MSPAGIAPQTWCGLCVHVRHDHPRMVLSAEVVPGVVPWPPGFKAEIDAWMLEFFGTQNPIADGQVFHLRVDHAVAMNPRTYAELLRHCAP